MKRTTVIVTAVALASGSLVAGTRATATHSPANKIAVASSTLEVMSSGITAGSESSTVTLMTASLRTSVPTDLLFRVTAECALWTDVTNVGNSSSQSIATVKVWIEVDGSRVPVSSGDAGEERGKVVFCNRDFRTVIADLDDEDATFQYFLRTRAANAFEWIKLNVGRGAHAIVVKAQLDVEVPQGTGMAKAAVGKRTLVVQPEKLANDVSI